MIIKKKRPTDTGPIHKELWSDLYSFCFALCGDNLLAEQLLPEAFTHFFREDSDLMLMRSSPKQHSLIATTLYRWCLRIARKKYAQAPGKGPFFKLGLNERAHLYLYEMSAFDRSARETILECDFEHLVSTTFEARYKLLALFGMGPYV